MNKFKDLLRARNIDAVILSGSANIRYVSGYLADYCYVIITDNQCYYLTDSRFLIEATRDLPETFDIVEIDSKNAYEKIKSIILAINANKIGMDTDIPFYTYRDLTAVLDGHEIIDVTDYILMLRSIKDEKEINSIVSAQRIAESALDKTLMSINEGISERELCALLNYNMSMAGSEGNSFDTIVAFGENSAIAHAKPGNRRLKEGDIILMDFGATYGGYHSDMTRSFVYAHAEPEVERMYNAVYKAQVEAIVAIKDGISCKDADAVARNVLQSYGYAEYFSHSLGHGVGLEIHEYPSLSMRAESEILREGMVVTVEPGIYIEGLGGIRIEDMLVIGKDKSLNLTVQDKQFRVIN